MSLSEGVYKQAQAKNTHNFLKSLVYLSITASYSGMRFMILSKLIRPQSIYWLIGVSITLKKM